MQWLCKTPMKGRSIGAGFRGVVERAEGSAEKLFRWFLKRQHEDDMLLYGEYIDDDAGEVEVEGKTKLGEKKAAGAAAAAAAVPAPASTNSDAKGKETRNVVRRRKKAGVSNTEEKMKALNNQERGIVVGSKSSIGFRVTATCLELFGTKTYSVKDTVLKPLKFRWDRRKKKWWRPIKSQTNAQALLGKVERRLFDEDLGLKMMPNY